MTAPLQLNNTRIQATLPLTNFMETVQLNHPLDRKLMRWADVHQYDNHGYTALYWAIYHHNCDNMHLLLEYGSTLKVSQSSNALFYAIDCDNLEVIKYFIEQGIDKEIIQNGHTLSEYAFKLGRISIFNYLK